MCILFFRSILSEIIVFVIWLIDMSFSTIYTNVTFSLSSLSQLEKKKNFYLV